MVFSSYTFVLQFLPLVFIGYLIAHRLGGSNWSVHFLAAVSFAFYGLFGLKLLGVLIISILFNYLAGQYICSKADDRTSAQRALLCAIAANVGLLGYLKYTNFFIDIVNSAAILFGVNPDSGFSHLGLIVPVGVSFFTFIQIGYLIDAYNNQLVKHDFARYVLFSAFFPCVTAGPLVMQKEVMPQLADTGIPAFDLRRLAVGLTMFGMGIFKKVVLADSIAPFADAVFNGVAAGNVVEPAIAWTGTICYSLQLYFDFSGYSDMAIGLGLIFGIKLPLNFNSPFKSTNISDFWRNWHMTMTRFFTSYIYTGMALNGMRKAANGNLGRVRRFLLVAAIPSIVTFVIAGAWHGAGFTFIVYGLLHGTAIAAYLAWREFSNKRVPTPIAWFMTMSVVWTGLVIFRAPDMTTATTILASMWNPLAHIQSGAVGVFAAFDISRAISMIVILGAITLLLPNTQQVLHLDWPTSDVKPTSTAQDAGLLTWRPKMTTAMVAASTYAAALTSIGSGTNFLYYQF